MAKRRKSGGLNRARRKSEALLEDGRYVRGRIDSQRGRTDGTDAMSAVSAVKPELPGTRKPRVTRATSLTVEDLAKLPRDAQVYVSPRGRARLAVYYRKPEAPQAPKPSTNPGSSSPEVDLSAIRAIVERGKRNA